MDFLARMNSALLYVEKHLNEEIDQSRLAYHACTSNYQFQRIFSFITGVSLAEYIRKRRMTLASIELQKTKRRIIDIAFDYGYESHESFSRAFKNVHGITPSEARKPGAILKAYPKLTFTVTIQGVEEMNYRIEKKPAFQMFGKEAVISATNGQNFIDIPQFWKDSFADGTVDSLYRATGKHCHEGYTGRYLVHSVMCYRETGQDSFPYMIAGMVDEESDTADWDIVTIPELEWAIFTTDHYTNETLIETVQTVWKRIFTEWFPTTGYTHASGPELEVYYTAGEDKDYCEVWIPIQR